jgi:hypothetical protein
MRRIKTRFTFHSREDHGRNFFRRQILRFPLTLDAEVGFAVAVNDGKGKRLDVLLNLFVCKASANEALNVVPGLIVTKFNAESAGSAYKVFLGFLCTWFLAA